MNKLIGLNYFRPLQALKRLAGSQSTLQVNSGQGEQRLTTILRNSFPKAVEINVSDISGGCGAMYEVVVESIEFDGKSRVQQHQMVNTVLKEEIKEMHGLRILTNVPKPD